MLVIRSEPPGAQVVIDGEVRGETPHVERYVHYGTREVTLIKPGFRTHRKMVELDAPWWQVFPFDLLTDVVLPFTFTDKVELAVPLEKEPEAGGAFQETYQRALEAREKANEPK
jgi:hypothetical protein